MGVSKIISGKAFFLCRNGTEYLDGILLTGEDTDAPFRECRE